MAFFNSILAPHETINCFVPISRKKLFFTFCTSMLTDLFPLACRLRIWSVSYPFLFPCSVFSDEKIFFWLHIFSSKDKKNVSRTEQKCDCGCSVSDDIHACEEFISDFLLLEESCLYLLTCFLGGDLLVCVCCFASSPDNKILVGWGRCVACRILDRSAVYTQGTQFFLSFRNCGWGRQY